MTRPDLDALAALYEKATPGPWRAVHCHHGGMLLQRDDAERAHIQPSIQIVPAEDAALIVAAVNALPALIARVRELERERDDAANARDVFANGLVGVAIGMMNDDDGAIRAAARAMRERCAQACAPPPICGSQGFAGPSCCILPPGHDGAHKYGEPRAWTPKECAAAIRALEV